MTQVQPSDHEREVAQQAAQRALADRAAHGLSGAHDPLGDAPRAPSRLRIRASGPLRGRVEVPGDKSISHRAVLLGALADGASHVRGFLPGADCRATVQIARALGVEVKVCGAPGPSDVQVAPRLELEVRGVGKHGLREPAAVLDCQNAGTALRLLAGLLAGQPFTSILTGSPQLCRRPMARVVDPLRAMGALILGAAGGRRAPLALAGTAERPLRGLVHAAPIASAQVKSALLLAGLYADGPVELREAGPSRDHTERMLRAMLDEGEGDALQRREGTVRIDGPHIRRLRPLDLKVPGDASSAAFLLAAAAIVPGSDITLVGVGTNPTRCGFLDALRIMGADLVLSNEREQAGEPVADLRLRHRPLRALTLDGPGIVRLVDELPVLAVVASQATGRTEIRDAAELRVKETDRITSTAATLSAFGARITATPDGFCIEGPAPLRAPEAGAVSGQGDHRIAMAAAVAGLVAAGETGVDGSEVTADSFPGFAEALRALGADVTAAGPERAAAGLYE